MHEFIFWYPLSIVQLWPGHHKVCCSILPIRTCISRVCWAGTEKKLDLQRFTKIYIYLHIPRSLWQGRWSGLIHWSNDVRASCSWPFLQGCRMIDPIPALTLLIWNKGQLKSRRGFESQLCLLGLPFTSLSLKLFPEDKDILWLLATRKGGNRRGNWKRTEHRARCSTQHSVYFVPLAHSSGLPGCDVHAWGTRDCLISFQKDNWNSHGILWQGACLMKWDNTTGPGLSHGVGQLSREEWTWVVTPACPQGACAGKWGWGRQSHWQPHWLWSSTLHFINFPTVIWASSVRGQG